MAVRVGEKLGVVFAVIDPGFAMGGDMESLRDVNAFFAGTTLRAMGGNLTYHQGKLQTAGVTKAQDRVWQRHMWSRSQEHLAG